MKLVKSLRWIAAAGIVFALSDSFAGMNVQGMNVQGMNVQGMNVQGMNVQGMNVQGMNVQGMNVQGMNVQGMNVQGMNVQGMNVQGMNVQGMQLRGIDRLRSPGASMTFDHTEYAQAQLAGRSVQGLQAASPPITYTATPQSTIDGVHLQASPTDSGPGSYLYVPGLAGTTNDVAGTFWNLAFRDPAGDTADVIAYVAAFEKDSQFNSSTSSSNADVYLYTVYFRQPATGQWMSLCPADPRNNGKATAMATPLDTSDWTSATSRARFAFACTASGVAAKCARNWGYKPWVSSPVDLAPYYRACIVAARADYCQDDQSFTRNGTTVDLFDVRPGLPSINPTVGLPYDPGAPGTMLHEEYQISIANRVGPGATLYQSGLESSRYPDLDPGRSCAAAPYIDRCDPAEPYTCYRANNLSAQPYGAMLAVNSPRHCAHNEEVAGDPLDPMCNACTTRVCDLDPTCCGDPGDTFYPRALVWDQACVTLRHQVCRSNPEADLWPVGNVATPAGTAPPVVLRGAVGAFDGFVTAGSVTYAEGWACDPDFPQGSSAVQVSVGGELGAAGTTLLTSTADQSLPSAGWREIVAAECGQGGGPHGFRVALPTGAAGQDVYVYGLDSTVPSAPFSLLRGGK
ncbi:MAG TPA: ADYC domain-containing protein, partial [Polyangia bacterium]|nr:ADYC domain-containing protein [Polyangia bacterium]